MTLPSIEVKGLTKNFSRGRPALHDATFRYDGSGAIGYLGPNGAGKTTTLKLLTGLLRPTQGSATVNGISVVQDRKHALADVGAIIESPEPYPSQTVAEAIAMVGEFRGGRSPDFGREIGDLNAKLDLPPLDARCGRLSKGQRQRVSIAASLVRDPRVIILDEPTSGLDPKERILIRNLLNELKKDHLILMSSHLMQEVTEICDHVIFINEGQILLRDSVENVATRFRTRAVEVEYATPMLIDRIKALGPMVGDVTVVGERRFRIGFDGTTSARSEILRGLVGLGPVLAYQSASLVLEDAYLALMQGENSNPGPTA
ncbi:MAG: ABC transporter ATP-binding protein [Thermoplasmata archaeon]|jgi:ABC-2 type transport system ATP-binding protein